MLNFNTFSGYGNGIKLGAKSAAKLSTTSMGSVTQPHTGHSALVKATKEKSDMPEAEYTT
jgi:hypothetical protein